MSLKLIKEVGSLRGTLDVIPLLEGLLAITFCKRIWAWEAEPAWPVDLASWIALV